MPSKRLTYPEKQKYNPYRRPDWRWRRANALMASGNYFSKKRDDLGTGIATAFVRERLKSYAEFWARRTRETFRHVAGAEAIFNSWSLTKLEIECRILARQSDVTIGDLMELPPETVQAYHDLFFDIRPDIEATFLHSAPGDRGSNLWPVGVDAGPPGLLPPRSRSC